jgi:glucose/arabinose dehydrogenase/mono/diheme cytochrome c family protein
MHTSNNRPFGLAGQIVALGVALACTACSVNPTGGLPPNAQVDAGEVSAQPPEADQTTESGHARAGEQPSMLRLPAELPTATGYTTIDAFAVSGGPGLSFRQPLSVVAPNGEKNRLFVVSKTGTIEVVTDLDGKSGGPTKAVFLDIGALLRKRGQQLGQQVDWGLRGLAFHPRYVENGYFFVTYDALVTENGRRLAFNCLSRFSVSKIDANKADPASEVVLFAQLDRDPSHNGGSLQFGDDGYLYVSVGDEANANDRYDNARFIDKGLFAAILRLDVDCRPTNLKPNPLPQKSTTFPDGVLADTYRIPADNPFVRANNYLGRDLDPKKVRTEMYATGLRMVWRFAFDRPTGRLFAADVGQDRWESLHLVVNGGNYGWPFREGTHDGPRLASLPADTKLLAPIYEYAHAPGFGFAPPGRGPGGRGPGRGGPRGARPGDGGGLFTGNSITGGTVYRGTRFAELTGSYIFGDYVTQRIWALREQNGKWTPGLLAINVGNVEVTSEPRNGDAIFSDLWGGKILRLERSGLQGDPPPALLSQVGAFKNLKTLEPLSGVVPYTPNVPFWSDYARKLRWVVLPKGDGRIGFSAQGNWTFPPGMVWVKHFEMEMTRGDPSTLRRLETRFLMKTGHGVYGITYKWRADQSDADLVGDAGIDEELCITVAGQPKKQVWRYPSRSECITCHSTVAGGVLAFNTFQLNGTANGEGPNQLEWMSKAGYFNSGTELPDLKTLPAFARHDDRAASLEWRVRSYLAVNCIQCHQPGGVAQGYFDVRPATELKSAGVINGQLMNDRGDPLAKVVMPGDLTHSMMLRRLQGRDAPRMPPLATSELDPNATALVEEWIKSLPKQRP